ncbi:MAG: hypothetical protein J0H73_13960 [Salana multivorans]|uniref:hypothetical protein n=1 Tax=Salana multivorans TaxID=120377 RepID=UPI000960898A|nr:hypothetical protein [Salana multivorans]MBN8883406.1 hypothetical protein [Salana multivorans]OJX94079.1 MAG: hypothetical protein BGO96_09745 [Micrococcales bacterium 73-15]
MSNTPTPTPAPSAAPAPGEPDGDLNSPPADPPAPAPAQETDWKAEARKWEARAKENAEKAKAHDAAVEASKTAEQKVADRLAAAEARVAEFETREQIAAWKAEVSTETGVPAVALAGSTREEIEAHAATLKPLITPTQPAPADPAVPTIGQQPQRPGNVPLKDQIAAAEAAGDKALVSTLKALMLGNSQ